MKRRSSVFGLVVVVSSFAWSASGQQILWMLTNGLPQSYFRSPSIGDDGTIYLGSYSDTSANEGLYAINRNGALKWKFPTQKSVTTDYPAIGSNGVIYIGTEGGTLYAVNPDGSLRWSFETGGKYVSGV